jgi:hypothetical protein
MEFMVTIHDTKTRETVREYPRTWDETCQVFKDAIAAGYRACPLVRDDVNNGWRFPLVKDEL